MIPENRRMPPLQYLKFAAGLRTMGKVETNCTEFLLCIIFFRVISP